MPILFSSSGGIPELVGKNSGIGLKVSEDWEKVIVPTKQEIHEGILQIIDNRKHMSDCARERALRLFDIENWIKRHKEVFEFLKNNI